MGIKKITFFDNVSNLKFLYDMAELCQQSSRNDLVFAEIGRLVLGLH